MLEKIKEDFTQDKKEWDNYFKKRETKWANFFNSYRTSTVISNKECQQLHQDQDTATRIQRIVHGFIQQKFNFASLEQLSAVIIQASLCGYSTQQQLHLQQISATSIQAVAHEFIVQQQMITKHIVAVIIQTNFHLAYQQRIIYKNNDELLDNWNYHNDSNNEKKEDEDHINILFPFLLFNMDNAIKLFGIIYHDVPNLLLSE
eukprot:9566706-Ditylum_brightwellii.AAC.1